MAEGSCRSRVGIPLVGVLLIIANASPRARAQINRYDALAGGAMVANRPMPATGSLLKDELLFQRATQVFL